MQGFKPALHFAEPEHLAHMHRLGKAFKVVATKIAIVEKPADQTMRYGRNDDCVGLCQRLQARYQVRGLANSSVLLRYTLSNQISNNNHARAYGDAALHRHICGFQSRDGLDDGKTGDDRPLSIVLVCRWIPEIREH